MARTQTKVTRRRGPAIVRYAGRRWRLVKEKTSSAGRAWCFLSRGKTIHTLVEEWVPAAAVRR